MASTYKESLVSGAMPEGDRPGSPSACLMSPVAVTSENPDRLAKAANMAGVGAWQWDIENGSLWVSEMTSAIFDRSAHQLSTMPQYLNCVHTEDLQFLVDSIKTAIEHRMTFSLDHRITLPSGGTRVVHACGRVDSGARGGLVVSGTVMDITERRHSELERSQALTDLDRRLSEQEFLLLGAVQHLQSHFASMSRILQEMGSTLGRVFRYPGSASADGPVSTDQSPGIALCVAHRKLENRAVRAERMLAGLLQIVQLGSLPMRLESLDMGILIHSVLKRIRRRWGDFAEVAVAGLPPCCGDRALVGELFTSLLGNAAEYLDRERRGSIEVRGSVIGEESIYIVEDNGIGIPPEHLDGVFQVFHQVNPDRSSGAGVGLTAARCIVQRHGGRLWVESELGRGSRFYAALAKA